MLPSAPRSCKVYTPGPLATAIISRLGTAGDLSWLEPSFGSGIFLEKLHALGVHRSQITAIDLDCKRQENDGLACTLRGTDFFRWCSRTEARFDRIVGNPPFVSINRLPVRLQASALRVRAPDGRNVPLSANCWYAFLCASLHLLDFGGSLGFVLPAAWDYAAYAAPLRDAVQKLFEWVEVHRSRTPIFPDVQEGSVVMLAQGFGKSPVGLRRFLYSSSEDLISRLVADQASATMKRSCVGASRQQGGCRLGDILNIRIGTVTGDVKFFLMTEQERRDKGLPWGSVKPVVSKARHLTASEITPSMWRALRDKGERVWLFHPSTADRSHRSVKAYLRLPASKGGCNRKAYKVRSRRPWYLAHVVGMCDGFVSGMSAAGPWICFSEMRVLSATNTLYVVNFRRRFARAEKFAWALAMLTTSARLSIDSKCRVYADGLKKHEPGDLADAVVPWPRRIENVEAVYKSALRALLANDERTAMFIADRALAGSN